MKFVRLIVIITVVFGLVIAQKTDQHQLSNIRLFEATRIRIQPEFSELGEPYKGFFDKTGSRLVLVNAPNIFVYDVNQNKVISHWHNSEIFDSSMTSDGQLFLNTTQSRPEVEIRMVSNGQKIKSYSYESEKPYTTMVLTNPNGQSYAIVVLGGPIVIYDLHTGHILRKIPYKSLSAAWSPDGKTLAFGSGFTETSRVYLYDVARGTTSKPLLIPGYTEISHIDSLVFSPDGTHLAVQNVDDRLTVFDLSKHKPVFTRITDPRFMDLNFTSDGRFLLAASRPEADLPKNTGAIYALELTRGSIVAQFRFPGGDTTQKAGTGFSVSPEGRSFFVVNSLYQTKGSLSDAITLASSR